MATIYDNENKKSVLIINGQKMTLEEFKKQQKEKNSNKKKSIKKKNNKEINVIGNEVEKIIKHNTALKSLSAYYDHAYKQWGTIGQTILNLKEIRPTFVSYRVKVRELNNLLTQIQTISKKNEKTIFQFVEKTSWKLDDIKQDINALIKGINNSGVCQQFKNHECINGKGKRLGLQTLSIKAVKAIDNIETIIKQLNDIVEDGVDVMEYEKHMSFKEIRRIL